MKLSLPIDNVAPLIPQSGEMVLIDRVLDYGDDFLVGEAMVHANHILLANGVLPTYTGIEIMAQGVAAWAGCHKQEKAVEQQKQAQVRLGYLLGTRKLHIYQPSIEIGTRLEIVVKMSIQDATGFGVFDCRLSDKQSKKVLLEGALNVFSPKDGKVTK